MGWRCRRVQHLAEIGCPRDCGPREAVTDDGFFFFSSRRRHTRFDCDWSSDVCSSDLLTLVPHTHWDREWYLPFEGFREHLIPTLDEVLDLLDRGYPHFHLDGQTALIDEDRKSTRLNSSHSQISYAVFCLTKKNTHASH